jgi:outer membrane usher protein FimD/PapC
VKAPLSSIFDSVPFTGIQLATDTDMIPESLRAASRLLFVVLP